MNTIERIERAIALSKINGWVNVHENGRFAHITITRSDGKPSRQKVYFSEAPSKMTIADMVDEINHRVRNMSRDFIDTH